MIYTVTCNPSLDYIVQVEGLQLGSVNRSSEEMIYSGGKGLNVSMVLKNLGHENVALGFVAGFTGIEIARAMQEYGCTTDFITLKKGVSRINIKLRSGEETEINGRGPEISEKALESLLQKLDKLKEGDILVLAGSIPSTMPSDAYERILERMEGKKIQAVADATGELLLRVLKYRPFLIKPNVHELGELFHKQLETEEEMIEYAEKLQQMGARNILVSMAKDGGILLAENGQIYRSGAPKGQLVNSVGAGDSMVAGFLAGYLETGDYKKAFKMGLATGSASAFSKELAARKEVEELLLQF